MTELEQQLMLSIERMHEGYMKEIKQLNSQVTILKTQVITLNELYRDLHRIISKED